MENFKYVVIQTYLSPLIELNLIVQYDRSPFGDERMSIVAYLHDRRFLRNIVILSVKRYFQSLLRILGKSFRAGLL